MDPTLFETLAGLAGRRDRSTAAIEKSWVLDRAVFANEVLDVADTDNGLYPTHRFKPVRKESAKRISLAEATGLSDQRTAVVYHHNKHRRGGHKKEIDHWKRQLPSCRHALRVRATAGNCLLGTQDTSSPKASLAGTRS